MNEHFRRAGLIAAGLGLLLSAPANATPPTISNVTVDTATGNVIVSGTCTPNVSGTAQVKVIFVDSSGASHVVKKANCPSTGSGTTKVKPAFIDLATSTPLPSGTYQVCLKQLSTTGCWATPISF